VRAISIGNGTGSREVIRFVTSLAVGGGPFLTFQRGGQRIRSIYLPASEIRQEFPILISRRCVEPSPSRGAPQNLWSLNSLVKIDPKSIGVVSKPASMLIVNGAPPEAPQHGRILRNRVGVDFEHALFRPAAHATGINERTAQKIEFSQ